MKSEDIRGSTMFEDLPVEVAERILTESESFDITEKYSALKTKSFCLSPIRRNEIINAIKRGATFMFKVGEGRYTSLRVISNTSGMIIDYNFSSEEYDNFDHGIGFDKDFLIIDYYGGGIRRATVSYEDIILTRNGVHDIFINRWSLCSDHIHEFETNYIKDKYDELESISSSLTRMWLLASLLEKDIDLAGFVTKRRRNYFDRSMPSGTRYYQYSITVNNYTLLNLLLE